MRFLRHLWFRLHRRQTHDELQEEVRQHLQKKTEDGIGQGLAETEAWRQAHLGFGNSALAT